MTPKSSLAARMRAGDRRAIARAITQVENGGAAGAAVLAALAPDLGHARVVGITGPPGAGKSTLVNALVKCLVKRSLRVGVVAVDPSSPITGGAVLGDRIRMAEMQQHEGVFIRSVAARGHLGGLSRTTAQVVNVFDAAGFDFVLVETVGAGQSEVEIAGVAGTRVVVCPPGLGDDVQALKAGILEIADVFVVNKADNPEAVRTERELLSMLALDGGPAKRPVFKTTATTGQGVGELLDWIETHAGGGDRRGAREHDGARELIGELAGRDAYARHLGIELVAGGKGTATVRMRIGPEHLNFWLGCHGGAIFSLADTALGLACNSYGSVAPLIDSHMTFAVSVMQGELITAHAIEISRTRKIAVYRIDVTREEGTLVGSLTGTVYLTGKPLPADPA